MSTSASELQAAVQAKEALEDQLKHFEETSSVKIQSLSQEHELNKEQFSLMREENTTLHTQLENLSTQLTALRQMTTDADAAAAAGGGDASRMDTSLLSRSFHEVS